MSAPVTTKTWTYHGLLSLVLMIALLSTLVAGESYSEQDVALASKTLSLLTVSNAPSSISVGQSTISTMRIEQPVLGSTVAITLDMNTMSALTLIGGFRALSVSRNAIGTLTIDGGVPVGATVALDLCTVTNIVVKGDLLGSLSITGSTIKTSSTEAVIIQGIWSAPVTIRSTTMTLEAEKECSKTYHALRAYSGPTTAAPTGDSSATTPLFTLENNTVSAKGAGSCPYGAPSASKFWLFTITGRAMLGQGSVVMRHNTVRFVGIRGGTALFSFQKTTLHGDLAPFFDPSNDLDVRAATSAILLDVAALVDARAQITWPVRWHPARTGSPGYMIYCRGDVNSTELSVRSGAVIETTLLVANGRLRDTRVAVTEATVDIDNTGGQQLLQVKGLERSELRVEDSDVSIATRTSCSVTLRLLLVQGSVDTQSVVRVTGNNLTMWSNVACPYGNSAASTIRVVHVSSASAVAAARQLLVRDNMVRSTSRGYFTYLRLATVVTGGFDQQTLDTNILHVVTGHYASVIEVDYLANATVSPTPLVHVTGGGTVRTSRNAFWLRVTKDLTNTVLTFDRITSYMAAVWVDTRVANVTLRLTRCDFTVDTADNTKAFQLGASTRPAMDILIDIQLSNITVITSKDCGATVTGVDLPFHAASENVRIIVHDSNVKALHSSSSCPYGAASASKTRAINLNVPQLSSVDFRRNNFTSNSLGVAVGTRLVGPVDGVNLDTLTTQGNAFIVRSRQYVSIVFQFTAGLANTSLTISEVLNPGMVHTTGTSGQYTHLVDVAGDLVNAAVVVDGVVANHTGIRVQGDVRKSTIDVRNSVLQSSATRSAWGIHIDGSVTQESTLRVSRSTISVTTRSDCSATARALSVNAVDASSVVEVTDGSKLEAYTSWKSCAYGSGSAAYAQAARIAGPVDATTSVRFAAGAVLVARGGKITTGLNFGNVVGTVSLPTITTSAFYRRHQLVYVTSLTNGSIELTGRNIGAECRGSLLLQVATLENSAAAISGIPASARACAVRMATVIGSTVTLQNIVSPIYISSTSFTRFLQLGEIKNGSTVRLRDVDASVTYPATNQGCVQGSTKLFVATVTSVTGGSLVDVRRSTFAIDTRQYRCQYSSGGRKDAPVAIMELRSATDSRVALRDIAAEARPRLDTHGSYFLVVAEGSGIQRGAVLDMADVTVNATIGAELQLDEPYRVVIRRTVVRPSIRLASALVKLTEFGLGNVSIADSAITTQTALVPTTPAPPSLRAVAFATSAVSSSGALVARRMNFRCDRVNVQLVADVESFPFASTRLVECGVCDISIDCNPDHALAVSGAAPSDCVCRCPDVPEHLAKRVRYDAECNLELIEVTPTRALTVTQRLSRSRSLRPSVSATVMKRNVLSRTVTSLQSPIVDEVPGTVTPPLDEPESPPSVTRTIPVSVEPTPAPAIPPPPTTTPAPTAPPRTSSVTPTLPLPPPPPPSRPRKAAKAVSEVMNPEAAEAVTSSASSAAAVGGATSATSATKASNMANIVGVAECHFDPEEDLEVTALEVFLVWDIGTTPFAPLLGPIVSTNFFAIFSHLVSFVLHFTAPAWKKTRLAVGILSPLLAGYLLPTTVSLATIVLGQAEEPFDRAVFGFGGLVVAAIVGFAPALPIVRQLRKGVPRDEDGKQLWPGTESMLLGLRYYYDVVRDETELLVLLSFFEDLGIAMLMSVVASAKIPGVDCKFVGIALCLLTILHLVYLGKVRPFRPRIDSAFAYLVGFLQCIVAMAVVGSLFKPSSVSLVGYLALMLGASFMVQTVVMLVWTVVQLRRRRQRSKLRVEKRMKRDLEATLQAPLLATPVADNDEARGDAPATNPLSPTSPASPIATRQPGRRRAPSAGSSDGAAVSSNGGPDVGAKHRGLRTPSSDALSTPDARPLPERQPRGRRAASSGNPASPSNPLALSSGVVAQWNADADSDDSDNMHAATRHHQSASPRAARGDLRRRLADDPDL